MPLGIGKLESLQALSNFIVNNDNGFQIRELGKLIHLGGRLCISGLQNVLDPLDVMGAFLNDKQGLEVLSMVCRKSLDDLRLRNGRVETEILDMLRPHKNLKQLYIKYYHGTRFPFWMGDPLFSNVVCIRLKNCKNCTSLPPLGQLPLLKDLHIEEMSAVKHVGYEFNGQGSTKPFPVLDNLSFVNMQEWENCLADEVPLANAMSKYLSSVTCLSIENIQKLKFMPKWITHGFKVDDLPLSKSSLFSCDRLSVYTENFGFVIAQLFGCSNLESLPNGWLQPRTNMKELVFSGCDKLASVMPNQLHNHCPLNSLQGLVVSRCPAAGGISSYFLEKGNFLTNLTSLNITNVGSPNCQIPQIQKDIKLFVILVNSNSITALPQHNPICNLM
ncbi:hypothetical protein Acr_15g0012670 [Actinidia rufa]|uniref:R13L1/DRL21-like LRR repeat region domain-containing protein n=1 Tax=Actinidia rufa TaxID=165716 RepID=A0A7J0FVD5_9ERIC|nr:hypothetical protein Acr_15g0012670 [Actinidia rufa]